MHNLDTAALDCLAALADDGSFERAAQRLSITQSAVSQRLRTLEAQVGQPLVVRSRPLRLTEAGKVLLRYRAPAAGAARRRGARARRARAHAGQRLPIAVNADSLATWVLPALDPLVQQGLRDGYGLELVVDDQDFTHDWLRQGAVLGCVSTVREALRGCRVRAAGRDALHRRREPLVRCRARRDAARACTRATSPRVPFLVFNRKDDMQSQWVSRAFGVRAPAAAGALRAVQRGVRACGRDGLGRRRACRSCRCAPRLDDGSLVPLEPAVTLPVSLHWHQWQAGNDEEAAPSLLDRIGAALAAGASSALADMDRVGSRTEPGRD